MRRRHSWLRRLLAPAIRGKRGFARDDKGAVLIEFAILSLPFFTLIFAILETAVVFLGGQILDAAVQDATRQLRTGQAQNTTGYNAASFRAEICEALYGMFDCTSARLWIKVSTVSTFTSATIVSPIDPACATSTDPDDCGFTEPETYQAGIGSSTVIVQAIYKWPTIVNLPGFNLETQAGPNRLLSAVRVFRNEPF
jgi:Flp pilus assembly protein TadG